MSEEKTPPAGKVGVPESGPGALCPEAQADGVPCQELGKDCSICERAVPRPEEAEEEQG